MISKNIQIILVLFIIIFIFCFVGVYILDINSNSKFKVMKINANRFGKVISNNYHSFNDNKNKYSLGEVIKSGYLNDVNSPFSNNKCSYDLSYVKIDDKSNSNKYLVTLLCDDYLIDNNNYNSNPTIYKLDGFYEEYKDNSYLVSLYSCSDVDKLSYYTYSNVLLDNINKIYNKNYKKLDDVSECKIDKKEFYRLKDKISY